MYNWPANLNKEKFQIKLRVDKLNCLRLYAFFTVQYFAADFQHKTKLIPARICAENKIICYSSCYEQFFYN